MCIDIFHEQRHYHIYFVPTWLEYKKNIYILLYIYNYLQTKFQGGFSAFVTSVVEHWLEQEIVIASFKDQNIKF